MRIRAIAAVAVAAVALSAASFTALRVTGSRATITSELIETDMAYFVDRCTEGDQKYCKFVRIAEEAMSGSFDKALADLAREDSGSDEQRTSCHDLSHLLGKVAYHRLGIVTVIKDIVNGCAGGIHHGAFEEWGSTSELSDMIQTAKIVCQPFKGKGTFVLELCTHGIGHALKRATDSMQEAALACKEALESRDAASCSDGVVATTIIEAQGPEHRQVPLATAEQFLKDCRSLPAAFLEPCARTIGFQAIASNSEDRFAAGFELCARDVAIASPCTTGLGMAVAMTNLTEPERSVGICSQVATGLLDSCLSGASRWIAMNLKDPVVAARVCEPAKDQPLCSALRPQYPDLTGTTGTTNLN